MLLVCHTSCIFSYFSRLCYTVNISNRVLYPWSAYELWYAQCRCVWSCVQERELFSSVHATVFLYDLWSDSAQAPTYVVIMSCVSLCFCEVYSHFNAIAMSVVVLVMADSRPRHFCHHYVFFRWRANAFAFDWKWFRRIFNALGPIKVLCGEIFRRNLQVLCFFFFCFFFCFSTSLSSSALAL